MAARQNIPAQLRLKEIQIQSLKGISNCTINFPADKKVTAIMGMNGSGKSTIIHALACCYKPRTATSKENNRFSDFLLRMMITTGVTVALLPTFTQAP